MFQYTTLSSSVAYPRGQWFMQDTSTEVKSECLDILCDVLHRFGSLMTADHEKLMNALLVQLNLQRAGLRKRAIQCLGKCVSLGARFSSRFLVCLGFGGIVGMQLEFGLDLV